MSQHPLTPALARVPLRVGVLDLGSRLLRSPGAEPTSLTTREAALLACLAGAEGQTVGVEQLLREVWGRPWSGEPAELGVLRNGVFKLRQKIERDAAAPEHLITVQNEGYRLVPLSALPPEAPPEAPPEPPLAPRPLLPPAGDRWSAAWDVGLGRERRQALAALEGPHRPLLLVAPWRGGKSWLLRGLLAQAQPLDRVVVLDPRALPAESTADLAGLAGLLACLIADALDLPEELADPVQLGAGPAGWRLKRWLEQQVLAVLPGRLWLAMEDLDRLATRPAFGDLMALLRAWTEDPRPGWERLRLVCTSATPAARLTALGAASPFNLGLTVPLGGLDAEALAELARRARVPLPAGWAQAVLDATGGHPHLARLVLEEATQVGAVAALAPAGLDRALEPAVAELSARLDAAPAIRAALERVLGDRQAPLSEAELGPLWRLGLLVQDRPPWVPRAPALAARLR